MIIKVAAACEQCLSIEGSQWPTVSLNLAGVPCTLALSKIAQSFDYGLSKQGHCFVMRPLNHDVFWVPIKHGALGLLSRLPGALKKDFGIFARGEQIGLRRFDKEVVDYIKSIDVGPQSGHVNLILSVVDVDRLHADVDWLEALDELIKKPLKKKKAVALNTFLQWLRDTFSAHVTFLSSPSFQMFFPGKLKWQQSFTIPQSRTIRKVSGEIKVQGGVSEFNKDGAAFHVKLSFVLPVLLQKKVGNKNTSLELDVPVKRPGYNLIYWSYYDFHNQQIQGGKRRLFDIIKSTEKT